MLAVGFQEFVTLSLCLLRKLTSSWVSGFVAKSCFYSRICSSLAERGKKFIFSHIAFGKLYLSPENIYLQILHWFVFAPKASFRVKCSSPVLPEGKVSFQSAWHNFTDVPESQALAEGAIFIILSSSPQEPRAKVYVPWEGASKGL